MKRRKSLIAALGGPVVLGRIHAVMDGVTKQLGGPARRRAVVLLASVLALAAADGGAVGAVAYQLEQALRIGNAQVGLAVTVSSLAGALVTIPMGALADRTSRVRLLYVSIALWGVAELASGLAPTYAVFLLTRIALGGVIATAGPAVASLAGDFFPTDERGKMYGFILTGEVLGAGLGIVVAGFASSLFGWRAAFVALAVPGALLAWAVRAFLPEPARGGQSQIEIGDRTIRSLGQIPGRGDATLEPTLQQRGDSLVVDVVERKGIRPKRSTVLSPGQALSLWRAVFFTLRVKTNVILIVASSLGYFFFSGLQTFTIIFLREHFDLSQATATLLVIIVGVAVVVGLLVAGNLGDKLIRRGRVDGRILIGAIGFLLAAGFLAPGIVSSSIVLSLPLFVLAGVAVSAPNPGLDAARLDVMPARVWGRAEAVRTVLRQGLVAFAPLVFGIVSEGFGGGHSGIGAGTDPNHSRLTTAQGQSLELTFLLMLVPVVIGGLILLRARRTYTHDVASAVESDRLYEQHRMGVR